MKVGIVTGASSGMGKEFALQLQDEHELDEVWLIARREDKLKETASKLDHIKGVTIPMSLTSKKDMDMLKEKIEHESPEIRFLVNDAGYGHVGAFEDAPLDRHLDMIDLNVKALVELTHTCLSHMNQGSVIFQVASISGFILGPNTAIYSATKAFVVSFSHALYQELKPKGIHVITVSPGPVDTMFWQVASDGTMEVPREAVHASDVVNLAIKDAKKGKLNSTYGFIPRVNIQIPRILSRKLLLKMLK